jgi:hypothetical protein
VALTYTVESSFARSGQRKLTGTRPEGPEWARVVKRLRSATLAAASKASWRPGTTPDSVGVPIIETLPDLHPGAQHVLALVHGFLLKASRR